jgi:TolB-like protein/DNA-binding winged helix-turn-helix (wHTH) protein
LTQRDSQFPPTTPEFEFAGFRLVAGTRQLFGPDGQPIPLTGRVFETLLCLVQHQGRLLDKNVLINTVWPNVVVEDNNLNQTVSALRKALGEGPGANRFIVTVPGRGYQFVPPVRVLPNVVPAAVPEAAPAAPIAALPLQPEAILRGGGMSGLAAPTPARWIWPGAAILVAVLALYLVMQLPFMTTPSAVPQENVATIASTIPLAANVLSNSVAVLPFENFSPDPADNYFASGIHEEILNQLTKLKQLTVIARTTMRQYEGTTKTIPEIARELNVQTVMEGNIRYANDRVRISANLIDAASGATLWSETYEREFDDIFAIESDIALQVASALRAEFTPDEQASVNAQLTSSTEAYTLYLAAREELERFQTAADVQAAIEKVELALALDPTFVNAYILKSAIYRRLVAYDSGRADEGRTVGEAAARRAVELDPESITARSGVAGILNELGRWQEAAAEFRNIPADVLAGDLDYGWFRYVTGFPRESLDPMQQSIEINPLVEEQRAFYISALDAVGQQAQALDIYRQGVNIFGDGFYGRFHVTKALLAMGNTDEAERVLALNPTPIHARLIELLETPEGANDMLTALRENSLFADNDGQQWLMVFAAWLDLPELALELVASRIKELPSTTYILWSPLFTGVREHEGFRTLVGDIGLVDYWRTYGWPEYCQPVTGTEDFTCH